MKNNYWAKFKHTLESCYLCMKYPFLYPRNRFTDRNRKNVLVKRLHKLYDAALMPISITAELEKEENKQKYYSNYANFLNVIVKLDKENKKVIIKNPIETIEHDLTKLLWNDDRFEILGISLVFSMLGTPIIKVCVKTKDENDKTNYGFSYEKVELTTNKWKKFWYKTLDWIDSEVLDRVFFIPTSTEWDAMPTGWRKAFGDQYLKDLKKQLKKDHILYSWRIMQIKEKFGTLRLYCNFGSDELYKLIDKYEDLSWHTCISCGKPAKYSTTGWICPYCEDCIKPFKETEKVNGIK